MTRDQADYALVHLSRAVTLLQYVGPLPPSAEDVAEEINKALMLLSQKAGPVRVEYVDPSIHADKSIRPGLNKPTEDAANV